jgi:O-acetylhomoserine (thiol)-lyase
MSNGRAPSGFATAAVHGGQSPDPTTLARGVPVYRTSSFVFKSAEHAANLFALKEFGNIYSRLGNPTNDVLEARVSGLEGGAASVAVASGTAAIFNTVITIAKAGDEIVSASNLYGGTYTMFGRYPAGLGHRDRWADARDPDSFEKAITNKTRLLYVETHRESCAGCGGSGRGFPVAKKHKLPLVVDGYFTTPLSAGRP